MSSELTPIAKPARREKNIDKDKEICFSLFIHTGIKTREYC